ncbi:NADP-dependent malic enzyme-like [Dendroctonus ponderosae]|uniref:NADP-dependent malic enzyme-like n=1 Tax=Dendroctonus ponderosae TaxID=77166 RepID=UPI00203525E4|nr:NADP-dependent malic enzyme-like [Dendroctonus ponderosae]
MLLSAVYNEPPVHGWTFEFANNTTFNHKDACTNGRCVFASGSPFAPVVLNGKTYEPGQGNNAYIFPGVGLGVICAGIKNIGEEHFLMAAEALASMVTEEDLDKGSIYPSLSRVTECSVKIAIQLLEFAYAKGNASVFPEPKDKEAFVRAQMYNTDYVPAIPSIYAYPKL